MKNITIILISMFLLCCKSEQEHLFCTNNKQTIATKERDSLLTDEINKLENGDIIMRQGRGAFSLAISANLNEKINVSHCGIIKKGNGKINVIHTLSFAVSNCDGVQQTILQDFVKDTYKNSIIVVRLKNSDNTKIVKKADYYLSKKIPFDNRLDFNDTAQFFCSELILRILEDEYNLHLINYEAKDATTLRFGIFLNPNHFETIINHQKNYFKSGSKALLL